MHSMLRKIIEQKRKEVELLKDDVAVIESVASARKIKDFKQHISGPDLSFIAEIKRQSPSRGKLAEIPDPEDLLQQYVTGGADVISVLTDELFFSGHLNDCVKVSVALKDSPICVLRKDFIIDEIQIDQSIAAGADVVLLIVSVLQDKVERLLSYAKNRGVAAIVEVHNEAEVFLARAAGAEIIGVNNRDLNTFEVDIENCLRLVKLIPDSILKIAESAIRTEEDIRRIKQAGFDAVLIGETLVVSSNPCETLKRLRAVS